MGLAIRPELKQFMVAGGEEGTKLLNSTELVTLSGEVTMGPEMPLPLMNQCLIHFNDSHAFMAGGALQILSSESSDKTFLFNYETKEWTDGPVLEHPICSHSCAVNPFFNDPGIVFVVGGRMSAGFNWKTDVYLDYPEACYIDPPEAGFECKILKQLRLPVSIRDTFLFARKAPNSLLFAGGNNLDFDEELGIYEIECKQSTDCKTMSDLSGWTKMPTELTFPTRGATILIPDFMTTCSPKSQPEVDGSTEEISCNSGVNLILVLAGCLIVFVTIVLTYHFMKTRRASLEYQVYV